jgi:hypothetical protein
MGITEPIGLAGLIQELRLEIPPPAVRSEAGPTSRRREEGADWVLEVYPNQYLSRTVRDNLRFALRYEPMDLRVWQAVIPALDAGAVVDWVKQQPTSAFARRAWYLYERLSGQRLPLDDLAFGSYVNLADPRIQSAAISRAEQLAWPCGRRRLLSPHPVKPQAERIPTTRLCTTG